MAPTVKSDLRDIWQAETRAAAEAAMDSFAEKYGTKYGNAVACLAKGREALLAFFDFPAEHWDHLRTANPIESGFATVRHRTVRTRGALSQKTAKLMVFTLVRAASKKMAPVEGRQPVASRRQRHQVHRRRRSRRCRNPRRLIRPRHPDSAIARHVPWRGVASECQHELRGGPGRSVRCCRQADDGSSGMGAMVARVNVALALGGLLVVLLEEDGADEARDCGLVGEGVDDLGAALDLVVQALQRVRRV